ncbi:MAG: PAS domain S-box protein [Pseudolabrys sp.]|nr:PAS domain S-box protein [Pseudolabrys sp.]MBV9955257.1 PAS domain S-box protein [Pseudolabrys sp.]
MSAVPDSKALLAAIVNSSDDAIVSKNLTSTIMSWNAGAERIFGYTADEMIGESILKIIPTDRHSEEVYILNLVKRGERINHYNTIRRCKDGRLINVSITVSPVRAEDGTIVGASKIARDITEWKITQDTQLLLLKEINHRSKNLLAVAEAIVRQTAKSTAPRELVSRITKRLHSLSVNQDLLIDRDWRGAEINRIVESQMNSVIDDFPARVQLDGPPTVVTPAVAQALGLTIYELTANAIKFGSLSTSYGGVKIRWGIEEENGARQFKMVWQEFGGPPAVAPKKKGFGNTIIADMIARSTLGKTDIQYGEAGLSWQLTAPESAVIELGRSLGGESRPGY